MQADQHSPYDVLDLPAFATESEVKKQYRKKSLMIHPDKFKHEQGHEVSSGVMLKGHC
jgi:DnaJ family protein C protein 8